jgi:PAS domain S-box-containing protein
MPEGSKTQLIQELKERLRFEKLITNLSATFVNLPPEKVDKQIKSGLKSVVEALGVDRSSFFQFSPDRTEMIVTHSYAKEGFEATPRLSAGMDFPWITSKLREGNTLPIASLKELPEEAALDLKNLERINIKSTLCIPISLEGSISCVLTLGSLKDERSWEAHLAPRLQVIGEVFANAIERKRSQERIEGQDGQIKEIRFMIRSILEYSPSVVYFKDLDGRYLLANRAFADRVSLEPDEIVGKTDFDMFPQEIADSYRAADRQAVKTEEAIKFDDICPHEDGMHAYISTRFPMHNSQGTICGVGGISTDINELKQAQEAIQERLQFQSLIAKLSAKFINLPVNKINSQIKDGLKQIAQLLELDRSSFFQYSEEKEDYISTHSYAVKGLTPRAKTSVKNSLSPLMSSSWRRGETICFSSQDELPKAAFGGASPDIAAGAAVPLSVKGSYDYVLSIGSLHTRQWPDDLQRRLRLIGEIFVNALERKKADDKITNLMSQLESDCVYLREEIESAHELAEIIGESHGLRYILHRITQIAPTPTPVLLLGETGTGKELVARAIHRLSDRQNRPLVKVNCAALPRTLIESELFGYEKGAFTDAQKQQVGRFEFADGATLFLDEIGELPIELQPKLLRVLEHGEFERLGSPRTIKVDVRIIAATNRNLEEEIREGRFREDLFYRLNIFPLSVPPLRQRKDDIPLLVEALVSRIGKEMGKKFDMIPEKIMRRMQDYDWPGNVRELENLIERAMIVSTEPKLIIELPELSRTTAFERRSLEDVEREHILKALESAGWKVKGTNGAAEILGLKPSTLRYRMQKLGIARPTQ